MIAFSLIFSFSQSSSKLPWAILKRSPSLLWMAARKGDTCTFGDLLQFLKPFGDVGKPEYPPGVGTIPAMALKSGCKGVLELILLNPSLFPR